MKSNKNTDDILREKLNNYSSAVPVGLFEAMDEKRKKPVGGTFFNYKVALLSSAILLSGLLVWKWTAANGVPTENTIKNVPVAENNTTTNQKNNINKVTTTNEVQSADIAAIQKKISSIESTEKIVKTKVSTAQKSTTESTSTTDFSTSKNIIQNNVNQNEAHTVTMKSTTSAPTTATTESNVSIDKKEETTTTKSDNIDAIVNTATHKQSQFVALNTLPALQQKDDYKYTAMPSIDCSWRGRRLFLYLDALASMDMAFRKLTPKTSEDSGYAETRNRTEGMRESFSLALRASVITDKGLAARTGIYYSQIQETFSESVTTLETRIIETRDEFGNIISRDTILAEVIQAYGAANTHKLVSIPFLIGYEFDKKKFNLGINAGALLNVKTSHAGSILNTNSEVINFTSDVNNVSSVFKSNIGWSLYGSFALNYKVTPALHFIFEPYANYYLNSFTLDSHSVEQNYFTAGMQVGLRMKM